MTALSDKHFFNEDCSIRDIKARQKELNGNTVEQPYIKPNFLYCSQCTLFVNDCIYMDIIDNYCCIFILKTDFIGDVKSDKNSSVLCLSGHHFVL